jgi:hypothetical protein
MSNVSQDHSSHSDESQDHSSHSDQSISSEKLEEMMWEEINDPIEAQLQAHLEGQLEVKLHAKLAGTSNKSGRNKRRYINRDHEEDHNRLFAKYFSSNPLYTDNQFRRRFRMRKYLFLRIVETLVVWSPFFVSEEMPLARWVYHHCRNALLQFECWHMEHRLILWMSLLV